MARRMTPTTTCEPGAAYGVTADDPSHGYHRALQCIDEIGPVCPLDRFDLQVTFIGTPGSWPIDYETSYFELTPRDDGLSYSPRVRASAYYKCYNKFGNPDPALRRQEIDVESRPKESTHDLLGRLTAQAETMAESLRRPEEGCNMVQFVELGPTPLTPLFVPDDSGEISVVAVYGARHEKYRKLSDYHEQRSETITIKAKPGESETETARRIAQMIRAKKGSDESFVNFQGVTGRQRIALMGAMTP